MKITAEKLGFWTGKALAHLLILVAVALVAWLWTGFIWGDYEIRTPLPRVTFTVLFLYFHHGVDVRRTRAGAE